MKNGFDFTKNNGYFQGWGQSCFPNESVSEAANPPLPKLASKLRGLKTDCKDKETALAKYAYDNSCIQSVLLCVQWKHTFSERLKSY